MTMLQDPFLFFKNKNVVVIGLGLFGGGVASARFCLAHGANVLVTDMKTAEQLAASLELFSPTEKARLTFVLGEHREKDFEHADIVMVNPAVPRENKFLAIAKKHGATFENDASLFMRFSTIPTIAITGTRGKTTTTNWITQLLRPTLGYTEPIGNSSNNPLLNELSKESIKKLHVAELSSWQLELLPKSGRAPHIAIITNIYPDHLNRYGGMEDYAEAKTNIFRHQNEKDFLILNYENEWRDFILAKKPLSQILFFSKKPLPQNTSGIYMEKGSIFMQQHGTKKEIVSASDFEKRWGVHNLENLLASLLSLCLYDPNFVITKDLLETLSEIPFRQQTIYKSGTLHIVNDTTATSPDGLIAAIRRFNSDTTMFISGGTRKDTSFEKAAAYIKEHLSPERFVLLSGSATDDLLVSLRVIQYDVQKIHIFETLEECVQCSLAQLPAGGTIVFSPGAASFEKFKNEFDRGEKFNTIVQKLIT